MSDDFVFVDPPTPIAGCVVVVVRERRLEALRLVQASNDRRRYIVRGFVTDQIPLTGNVDDLMAAPPPDLVRLNSSPLSIYLHPGGAGAVFYDLCANADGYLTNVAVEVEGTSPGNVLGPGRTAINNMLDKLVGSAWMPLTISRLELCVKGDSEPLAYQFLMPFTSGGLHLGPLGGMDTIPFFEPQEALIREAINSPSPFYRFLCAYRLYEGMNELRRTIRRIRDKVDVTVKLPPDPQVDVAMLRSLGASPKFLVGIRTVQDLHAKLTEARNRVAHFLLKGAKFVVSTSNGTFYTDYAMTGAVLLHYAHQCLVDLRIYCVKHLDSKARFGEVLPLLENRDQFVVRVE